MRHNWNHSRRTLLITVVLLLSILLLVGCQTQKAKDDPSPTENLSDQKNNLSLKTNLSFTNKPFIIAPGSVYPLTIELKEDQKTTTISVKDGVRFSIDDSTI